MLMFWQNNQATIENLVIRNNIFYGGRLVAILISNRDSYIDNTNLLMENNAYFTTGRVVTWNWTHYTIDEFAQYQQDSGKDQNSFVADPLFVDAANGDFHLQQTAAGNPANSPCLDKGSAEAVSLCLDAAGDHICMNSRTTRSDGVHDTGTVDLGWHSR